MPDNSLDIQHLKRSSRYEVRRAFIDYYGNRFLQGDVLTFVEYQFLPYHGGYTVVFQEKVLYLQEEANAAILDSLGRYLTEIVD
jgi:hypothetical protein